MDFDDLSLNEEESAICAINPDAKPGEECVVCEG